MGEAEWRGWIDLAIKGVVGVWAAYQFMRKVRSDRYSARTERARWATHLYEKFYENKALKQIREDFDCGDEETIAQIVKAETPEFTDYLNFFEYVAYLKRNKQLSMDEVEGLFGYYLDCMAKSPAIDAYVADTKKNSYDYLHELMRSR